jgi:guanine nucleotide exchange factor
MSNSKNNLIEPSTNKNRAKIKCSRCPSLILSKSNAILVHREQELPLTCQSKKDIVQNRNFESELISDFWLVNDMLTFENIGFTNTVGNWKYLICADCEIGPLGFQSMENKNELFIAVDRVSYEE